GGARLMVLPDAKYAVESGLLAPDDPQFGLWPPFPPARVDALLSDGQTVLVGPLKLTAHSTFGHVRGSTSWTWKACEGDTCRRIVYADSRSEEHTSELQSRSDLVCRLLLEKKKK